MYSFGHILVALINLILNVTGLIISFLSKHFYSGFYHQGVVAARAARLSIAAANNRCHWNTEAFTGVEYR